VTGVFGTIGGGLNTALYLARGRPEGLARLVAPPADPHRVAARSFVALLVCLPPFLLLDIWDAADPVDAGAVAIDVVGYVVGWVGFAVLSWEMVRRVGREALWWRFVAAWNWSNVAQSALLFVAGLLAHLGAPDAVVEVAWVFAAGWAMWIEWYATRLTLNLSGVAAAGLVAIDLMVSLMASAAASSLTG
jgi:hypothetical protein